MGLKNFWLQLYIKYAILLNLELTQESINSNRWGYVYLKAEQLAFMVIIMS